MQSLNKNQFIKNKYLVETFDRIEDVYNYTYRDDEVFIRFVSSEKNRFGMNYGRRDHRDPVGIYAYNVKYQINNRKHFYAYNLEYGYVFKYPWKKLVEEGKCIIANKFPQNRLKELFYYIYNTFPRAKERVDENSGDIDSYISTYGNDVQWFNTITNHMGLAPAQMTKAFLANGIDSIYDIGKSVINGAEPCQLLCFTEKYIRILDINEKKNKAIATIKKINQIFSNYTEEDAMKEITFQLKNSTFDSLDAKKIIDYLVYRLKNNISNQLMQVLLSIGKSWDILNALLSNNINISEDLLSKLLVRSYSVVRIVSLLHKYGKEGLLTDKMIEIEMGKSPSQTIEALAKYLPNKLTDKIIEIGMEKSPVHTIEVLAQYSSNKLTDKIIELGMEEDPDYTIVSLNLYKLLNKFYNILNKYGY